MLCKEVYSYDRPLLHSPEQIYYMRIGQFDFNVPYAQRSKEQNV